MRNGILLCDNPIDDVMRGDCRSMTHDSIVEGGAYYTIPFHSLVPKEVENLMFAGRLISADPMTFASVRGMPQCMLMVQSIGLGAFYIINEAIVVQKIDSNKILKDMQNQGVSGIGKERL